MRMQSKSLSQAPALTLFPGLKPPHKTLLFHQICVLVITFLAYASFHASRKPPSIVKSVLGPTISSNETQVDNLSSNDAGWVPFNGTRGTHRLEDMGFVHPGMDIEMSAETHSAENLQKVESEEAKLIESDHSDSSSAIGFLEAWKLPGVAPFSFCLFFSKLVAYTFLYWLPFYIRHTAVAGVHISNKTAGLLSTIFDIGGVLGGITAGFISDMIEARAITSIMFLFLSIPALVLYRAFGSLSMLTNILLMFLSGFLVNGPYSLITTAVAADLGTQSLNGRNSRALATVTAIIDGTGSVGAALGPLLAGYISTKGWNSVFFMLILSIFFAGLFLIRVARTEIREKLSGK
ncbi:putative glycerol-3-phosphate transporter 5 isoform X2 [Abrus precatorius]|uniref:Glycerol-3-phosphate transporter 5 isoform X2 n=1 Tax=Abrus precatorius TaxID=3816 RepID=A0A8B8M8L1_ABRPR|nr:putative glycerol-3-phosphate transporter 5 isoform X2 [Abrus precatorius]